MYRLIPLEVFESSELPVLAIDADGHVQYYNRAAGELAGCEPGEWIGRPCWRFFRLKDREGAPFCGRDCPAMRAAREGVAPHVLPVVFQRPAREPVRLTLLSFPVPPPRNGRWAMLHLVQRVTDQPVETSLFPDRRTIVESPPAAPAQFDRRLERLTRREREILDALAEGREVQEIADRSGISILTARNHIQHILRKLHLHRQVDAILMLLARPPAAPPRA